MANTSLSQAIYYNDTVKIAHLGDSWAHGASESLSGLTGIVKEYEPTNNYGHPNERPYLVEFPNPPKPWWTNQRPGRCWWFSREEILKLAGGES